MPKFFVYSSKYSDGAKELASALHAKRIKATGSSYQGLPTHRVINWGSTHPSVGFGQARVFNPPSVVKRSSNKLTFFQHIGEQARVPEWTDNCDTARQWLANSVVIARTILSGHSGQGIVVLEPGVDFVDAPLYTKYVKKEAEYRVHCIRDHNVSITEAGNNASRAFDVQRKIKDPAFVGTPNWRVRNHQNGFIYVRDNIQVPEDVTRQALQAFAASGLDFGAVDVIWNHQRSQAYVLEINTAPGLVGRSVESYKEAILSAFAGS